MQAWLFSAHCQKPRDHADVLMWPPHTNLSLGFGLAAMPGPAAVQQSQLF